MIKEVQQNELVECVKVICESFKTVADELGFTAENAPRFTAFVSDGTLWEAQTALCFR